MVLPDASANPDFEIAQLQDVQDVEEHAFGTRLDFKFTPNWSSYLRVFHDQGTSIAPEGVSGRTVKFTGPRERGC